MTWSPSESEVIAEFLGTFLFVLTIPLSELGIGSLAPIPIGFMLMAMVFTFGYISGGHFNPAVTFATVLTGHTSTPKFIRYTIAQVTASIAAALYGSIIVGVNFPVPTVNSLTTVWQGLLSEWVYTFALASVVLHVAYSRQRSNDFYGFAIGMCVLSAAFSVGGVTGGSFNPAVATGTQLVGCIMNNCGPLAFVWMYWIAPMAGAFAAAFFYNILDTEHPGGAGQPAAATNGNQRLEDIH
jgi:glycerol uptake facilitator-like aquaporin